MALVEVVMVVRTVFRRYEVELEDKRREWVLGKQWFVWLSGDRVRMRGFGGV